MKKQYPLTSEGVKCLQIELYALSELKIGQEIAALKNDFGSWIRERLQVSSVHQEFLTHCQPSFLTYSLECIVFALENRLPIFYNGYALSATGGSRIEKVTIFNKIGMGSDGQCSGGIILDIRTGNKPPEENGL